MKRKQHQKSAKPNRKIHPIDPDRLTRVRGGGDLGIAALKIGPTPFDMPLQHNEALVRL